MSRPTPKHPDYYGQSRADVIAELRSPVGRVLDVGCGAGGANEPLRAAGATWISGVELEPGPAAKAAERYDEVQVGDALETLGRVTGPFDTILCYDVLEHLVDPAAVVTRLRELSAPGGVLHVSVPNARHWSLVRDLVLRGTFGYAEFGHRDSTHLRWFTRRDMLELLTAAGWRPESSASSAQHRLEQLRMPVPRRIVDGLGGEFMTRQWFIAARSPGS